MYILLLQCRYVYVQSVSPANSVRWFPFFAQVCIVKKKDTKDLYAMKYMNKTNIITKKAARDVLRELKILSSLDHPFLVRLWFSFQDEEDLFLVMDLLLGGDLRFHLGQRSCFSLDCVRLYTAEMVLALEYLRGRQIVHRWDCWWLCDMSHLSSLFSHAET